MYLYIVTDRVDMVVVDVMEEVDMTEVTEGVDMVEGVDMAVEEDLPRLITDDDHLHLTTGADVTPDQGADHRFQAACSDPHRPAQPRHARATLGGPQRAPRLPSHAGRELHAQRCTCAEPDGAPACHREDQRVRR